MNFKDFVDREAKKAGQTRTRYLKDLSNTSQISLVTLQSVYNGAKMRNYPKASAVSKATAGVVSVAELCDS